MTGGMERQSVACYYPEIKEIRAWRKRARRERTMRLALQYSTYRGEEHDNER
jgi:hypothetical protein